MRTKSITKKQIFSGIEKKRLIKEYAYPSKTAFFVTIASKGDLIMSFEDNTNNFDDLIDLAENLYQNFRPYCNESDIAIIRLAEQIRAGLIAVYNFYLN